MVKKKNTQILPIVKMSNGQMVEWSKKEHSDLTNWNLIFETLYFILYTLYLGLWTSDFKTTHEHAHFHDQQFIFNDICRLF